MRRDLEIEHIKKMILFWESKLEEFESIDLSLERNLKEAINKFARITTTSHIRGKLVFDVVFDYDKYEIVCSTHEENMNSRLPDAEDFEVLEVETYEVKESNRGPYHNEKKLISKMTACVEDLDFELIAKRALGV